jgi:hypothetical protein
VNGGMHLAIIIDTSNDTDEYLRRGWWAGEIALENLMN